MLNYNFGWIVIDVTVLVVAFWMINVKSYSMKYAHEVYPISSRQACFSFLI